MIQQAIEQPKREFISPYVFVGLKNHDKTYNKAQKIINTVCLAYDVEFKKIDNKKRDREIVQVRQAIMYFLRKETSLSLKAISALFKDPFDHSTTIHGIKTYYDIYHQDKMMLANHDIILEKLSVL